MPDPMLRILQEAIRHYDAEQVFAELKEFFEGPEDTEANDPKPTPDPAHTGKEAEDAS